MLKEAFFLSFLLLLLSARTRDLAAFYCTDVDLDGMCWRRGGGIKRKKICGFRTLPSRAFLSYICASKKSSKKRA